MSTRRRAHAGIEVNGNQPLTEHPGLNRDIATRAEGHLISFWFQTALADTCSSYEAPETIGEVSGSVIDEASGLAASRTRDGVFFTHGDAADPTMLVRMRGMRFAYSNHR